MNPDHLIANPKIAFDFESILEPIGAQVFFERYWEREPMILHREQPTYFNSLFSIGEVDRVLDLNRPTGQSIRVVKSQEPMLPAKYENPDGSLNLNQLYAAYADGYTVVVNEIERFWQPLKALCLQMSNQLSHHTVANMYLTPKNEKALLPHYDTHDVFVIQVHGKKHWKIYDTEVESPLLHSFQPIFQREQLKNVRDITLYAGDVMYMPRGVPHEAYTSDDSSLHLTIGVHPAQWVDLLTHAIKQLAFSKVELRKDLPPGYLKPERWTPEFFQEMQQRFAQLLGAASQEANIQGAIHLLSEDFRNQHVPMGDGHFGQIDQMEALSLDTYLEKRQDMPCTAQHLGATARIVFPGNMIKGPAHIADALQFISAAEGAFLLSDLPGISDVNKTKLAARLIRGGLLRIRE